MILFAVSSVSVISGPHLSSQALLIPDKSQAHLTSAQHKISPLLRHTYSELEEANATSYNAATLRVAERFSSPLVRVDDTARVQVYLKVDFLDDDIQEILKSGGVEIEIANEEWNLIQAWIPSEDVEIIANFDFIHYIRPPDYGTFNSSLVNVDGAAELSLPSTGGEFDIDGSGVRVGVISGGVKTLTDTVERSDLPGAILETGSCATPGCDEGTLMLDVLYATAPGVTAGCCAPGPTLTTLSFINCVTWLTHTFEAAVIVDDVVFVAPPYFEDGMVAQTVAQTVASGVTYVSTAGNFAQWHYEADFVENVDFTGIAVHDFGVAAGGAGDVFDTVGNATNGGMVSPGGCVTAYLQWSDPWGASSNDYDLFIVDSERSPLNTPGTGQAVQDGDDTPREVAQYCNQSAVPVSTSVVVQKLRGQDHRIEMFVQSTDVADSIPHHEYTVAAGSIIGHQAIRGVLTVAMVRDNEGLKEVPSSSSRGPSNIYHPAVESRDKPDVAALDCVELMSAGGVQQTVCGASAAAAQVAGIAALLIEANPDLTGQQVSDVLTSTATDIAAGDVLSRLGLVDVVAALNAVRSSMKLIAPSGINRLETATAQAVIEYTDSPQALIIKFEERFGEIGGTGPGPSVEVYGDGRVSVFYPHYMKRAGTHHLQLTPEEMERLLQLLSAQNIPAFDSAAVRQIRELAVAAEEVRSGMLFYSTDPSTTILELYLDQYASASPPGQEPIPVQQRIVWQGLRADARRLPDVEAIQNLFTAHQELRSLMEHPALE